ncbi:hypothetical protein RIN58_12530 [Siccibacter colletis]|uniref:hypothetical protein n=1 Tax=Siccibacter colletis TaxID=1505757 RepID=UPI0028BD1A16|nr:hypothetical protein [Siccibacter colletis]WNN47240.1 hypothetical protein RIN58_12530 [Siccibacter colletis]
MLEKINSLPGILVQYFLADLSTPDDFFANALKRDRYFYDENVLLQLSEAGAYIEEKVKISDCYLLFNTGGKYCGPVIF